MPKGERKWPMSGMIHPLMAISPIDGRYRKTTEPLAEIFSEYGLIKRRVRVELAYFKKLAEFIGLRPFTESEKAFLDSFECDLEGAGIVKEIETKGWGKIPATNHDVKAVELYLRWNFENLTLGDMVQWIHFALTSEDVNNIAYALQLQDGLEVVYLAIENCVDSILSFADISNVPMLARTHGQPAAPTTLKKEMLVFAYRLDRMHGCLGERALLLKLNGSTGNWSAWKAAYPDKDWKAFSDRFIRSFNSDVKLLEFEHNECTTQIEPHDTYAELFHELFRINTVLISFCQDMWRYISDDWITQIPVAGEVGSSVLPQKVNPINFENAEGNLQFANAMLGFFAGTLPIARLQRHLSDSTIIRNFGVAFGHCLVGYENIQKGMKKIAPNERKIRADLEAHPEVVAEGIQTILRREGIPDAYNMLKELTRGKDMTRDLILEFIAGLFVSDSVKEELRALTPQNYLGYAAD